jgi:urease accessory protein
MTDLPPARAVMPAAEAPPHPACDTVTLSYDDRLLRRRRLETAQGAGVLVDLAQTVSLDHGDRLVLTDGRQIEVVAAEEALLEVTAAPADLPRLAWHIGNRHAPAMFVTEGGAPRLLLRHDPVLRRMLEGLGARVTDRRLPFTPEGGAYGTGRTMGHGHGHGHAHGDAGDPARSHPHDHDHDHRHDHGDDSDHGHPHSHSHDHA